MDLTQTKITVVVSDKLALVKNTFLLKKAAKIKELSHGMKSLQVNRNASTRQQSTQFPLILQNTSQILLEPFLFLVKSKKKKCIPLPLTNLSSRETSKIGSYQTARFLSNSSSRLHMIYKLT